MMSRGFLYTLGTGARKSLVLLWTAVLLCSLLLQYVAIAAPSPVLAVHDDGLFELDGNVEGQPAPGDDWNPVFNNASSAGETLFVTDPINGNGDKYFTGGNTKDIADFPSWLWTTISQPQDKNDIEDGYAAAYKQAVTGNVIAYFGLDRYASNGAAQVGFWFLQDTTVGLTTGPGGTSGGFSGHHVNGDVLVQINFENGGASPVMVIYEWQNGLQQVSTGGSCATAGANDTRCAIAATGDTDPAWTFDDKSVAGANNLIPAGGMVEGGIDLTALGLADGCFSSFVAETRSSPSADSTLSDFASGAFSLCARPEIATQVKQGDTNVSTINKGESVTDVATLTGDSGTVTGSVQFFTCFDAAAAPDCSTGGTSRGTKTLSGGVATSDPFPPASVGYYCFRAEYTPAAGSKYFETSHTNKTTECVQVIPAEIDLTKTADQAAVAAGNNIGFTLSITSKGPGSAFGVKVTDTVPTKAGLNWSIDAAGTTGTWSLAGGILSFGGASGVTMDKDAEFHVHITSPTTPATCGAVNNMGDATTTNDGTDSASASVTVNCPDVKVTKTPDGGTINAGETATFSIKVENIGQGTAKAVTLHDALPGTAAVHWTTGDAGCAITGADGAQVLDCTVGDLVPGGSKTYTVSANLAGKTFCGPLDNSATASATNEASGALANNTDTGSITVQCASIDIEKVADAPSVSAGDAIGFLVTVTRNGPGEAKGVPLTEPMPTHAGTSWTINGGTAAAQCAITAGTLTCNLGDLASGQVRTVHITSPTTKATVADSPVVNTAHVTTTNDGSDDDTDQVVVLGASIDIEKVADAPSVSAGDAIGFLITVTSNGPGEAKGVTVTDPMPTDAGTSWTINGGTAAAQCAITAGTLTCNLGDLASGQVRTVHITSPTTKATVADSPVVNTAHVTTTNDGSDDDTDQVVVLGASIQVVKTADNSPISAGDKASYTITVTNIGDGIARGATLSDTLPTGIEWTTNTAGCQVATGVLTCSFGDLDPDAVRVVNVSGETDAQDCHELPNTATVAATNEPGNLLANNTSSASITVNCPAVVITKTPVDPEVNATDQIAFDVVVSNTGAGTAFAVTVNDTLPTTAGLAWTIDAANSDAGWSIQAGVLKFGPAALLSNTSTKVRIVSPTTTATCPSVHNQAFLTYLGGSGADDGDIAVDCPDIKVTKTADNSPISAGETAAFTITVENIGVGTAYDVTLQDVLPAGVTWTTGNADCGIASGTLSCEFGDLAPGDPQTIHVSGPTAPAACTPLVNTATASSTNEPSGLLANNTDGDTVQIDCPAISLTKVALDSSVNATDGVAFDIVLTNTGAGAAFNVAVNDPLPTTAGTAWSIDVANSDIGWTISGGVLKYTAAGFAAGGSVKVRIVSDTTAPSCGDIDNTATVTYDGGGTEASDTITVSCPDVVISKTADNSPILAGQTASFTIAAWNEGPGTAYGVEITDTLPAGVAWQSDNEACSITSGVLTCDVGTLTAQDAPFTVTISGPTDQADCGTIPNEATVSATNEPSD